MTKADETADHLRELRDSAMARLCLTSALFFANKILTITGSDEDRLMLGRIHFLNGEYSRCIQLLGILSPAMTSLEYLGGSVEYQLPSARLAAIHLTAQSHTKLEQWQNAMDILDLAESGGINTTVDPFTDGIKLMACIYCLKGKIYARRNNLPLATKMFKEALRIDVRCYEALEALISSHLIPADEEREFLKSLPFQQFPKMQDLLHFLYEHRLTKSATSEKKHMHRFHLEENPDLMIDRAEFLYRHCRFDSALQITSALVEKDSFDQKVLQLHLSLLYRLERKADLFLIAHRLVDSYPKSCVSWYAVACYYLCIKKNIEARKYFSQATTLNSSFAEGWVGFAHTFAFEGDHDQAIAAYSTAIRLNPCNYLPHLFMGMQYLQVHNFPIAAEVLRTAHRLCGGHDPLVLNELGNLEYQTEQFANARNYFREALDIATKLKYDSKTIENISSNLGHAFLRLGNYGSARTHFERALQIAPHSASNVRSLGSLAFIEGDLDAACSYFHQVLGMEPEDGVAAELLEQALNRLPRSTQFWASIPRISAQPSRQRMRVVIDTAFEDSDDGDEMSATIAAEKAEQQQRAGHRDRGEPFTAKSDTRNPFSAPVVANPIAVSSDNQSPAPLTRNRAKQLQQQSNLGSSNADDEEDDMDLDSSDAE